MSRVLFFLFFFLWITLISAQPITERTLPPAPLYKCGDAPAVLNQILYGATPPNSESKPTIVFVHGWFDNGYAWFMSKNKWYQNAYNNGYKTAFLFQSFSGSFQDNGLMVANMIRKVCSHYNTNNVIVVAHSKGGFDTEWAMYNYGIHDSVKAVISLSTPFWGAPMSDLISNPIIRVLLENIPLVGPIFKGAGTYQMQTAYMAGVVRPMLDNHPNNEPEKFRCFGATGYSHRTQFPTPISDDLLKVVLYEKYKPLCFDIPGMNTLAGTLMGAFMTFTGTATRLIPVQQAYNNPYNNTKLNDGLSPYYSSIRPGGIEASEGANASSSNLNHIDVLLTHYTWDRVNEQIENIIQANTAPRQKHNYAITKDIASDISSNLQFVTDCKEFYFNYNSSSENSITVIGNYQDVEYTIYNEDNTIISKATITNTARTIWETFKTLELPDLENGEYKIKTNQPIHALIIDANPASIHISIANDRISVNLLEWNEAISSINVYATLNRNIDENGNVIKDEIIPISLTHNQETNLFESESIYQLVKDGIYNISVYVNGITTQRMVSTSYLAKKETNNNSLNQTIKVYPTICTDGVTLSNLKQENLKNKKVKLYNLTGKVVTTETITEDCTNYYLSLNNLPLAKGMYLIQLDYEPPQKIIIQ